MNPWRGLRGIPGHVWLVCTADFINRAGTMALMFLVPCLTLGRHWSLGMVSLALTIYGVARMACAPFTGPLIDRIGAVRVLKGSVIGAGVALLALPQFPSPAPTFVLVALWGASAQATGPACMALLAGLAPQDKRRAVFALQRLGANLGMSIGPALGGFLAHVDYDWVFWVNGATALATAVFVSARLNAVPREPQRPKAERARSAWRDRRVLYLLLGALPALIVFFQTEGTVSLWVLELGFDTRFLGLMFTLNTLIIVLVEVALNLAMSRWSHRATFMLGAAAMAAGFGGLGLAHGRLELMGCVALWTFGEMILIPGLSDAVAGLAPAERRGEYMGLFAMTFSVAISIGPAIGIQAYEHLGPQATWAGCFLFGLLSVGLLGRIRPPATLPSDGALPTAPTAEQAK